jgi:probable HAF family extracellular repeat protein
LEDRRVLSAYTILDLGTLGTSPKSAAYAVNEQAQVAGMSYSGPASQAFLWDSGAGMQDLGQLQPPHANARGINDLGQVVGDSNSRAFVWTPDGGMRSLGSLGAGTSYANDINNAGQVVGWSYLTSTGGMRAFLINPEDTDQDGAADRWFRDNDANGVNDLMLDLGAFGGSASMAMSINDAGQVAGKVMTYSGTAPNATLADQEAFLWDSVNGGMLLGALPGDTGAEANTINEAGQVAGASGSVGIEQTSPLARRTLFIQREAFVWQDGAKTPLAALPGDGRSVALGLNDAGAVVGQSISLRWNGFSWVPQTYRGVVWDDGMPIDLNAAIDPAQGWQITSGSDVNEQGHIVGHGTLNGQTRAFLMIPASAATLAVNDVIVTESDAGHAQAVFTVSRSGPLDETATVVYSTADGTALAGSDYQTASGTLTFAPGEAAQSVAVLVNGDTQDEIDEAFIIRLSSPANAFLADGLGQATIVDNDAPPALSINDVAIVEGNSGIRYAVFTVTLSAASEKIVSVNFATANGTAKTSDNDYVAASGGLTFNPGETVQTITVQIKGDKKKEAHETFFINLSAALNSTLADSQGLGTIQNDD